MVEEGTAATSEIKNEIVGESYPELVPGDLVWGRLRGYPWWPSLVTQETLCDDSTPHFRTSKSQYHLQFLGPKIEHAWVGSAWIKKFEKTADFEELVKIPDTRLSKVQQKKPPVPKHLRQQWRDANAEAVKFKTIEHPNLRLDALFYKLSGIKKKFVEKAVEESKKSPDSKATSADIAVEGDELDVESSSAKKSLKRRSRTPKRKLKSLEFSDTSDDAEPLAKLHRKSHRHSKNHAKRKSAAAADDILADIILKNALEKLRTSLSDQKDGRKRKLSDGGSERSTQESTQKKLEELRKKKRPDSDDVQIKNPFLAEDSLSLKALRRKLVSSTKSPMNSILLSKLDEVLEQRGESNSYESKVSVSDSESSQTSVSDDKGPYVRDRVCKICEKCDNKLLICQDCQFGFHLACTDELTADKSDYHCKDCREGKRFCYDCRKEALEPECFVCPVSNCRKVYHQSCLERYTSKMSEKELAALKKKPGCPQHTCATCFALDNRDPLAFKGKMQKCVRCPVAYHSKPDLDCHPAGAELINGNLLICTSHYSRDVVSKKMGHKNRLVKYHMNVNWCFLCSSGGSLLLCDQCPGAFHLECLKLTEMPADNWVCENCQAGLLPRYNDIVWAKVGNYRWWPARIVEPWNVPENIQKHVHGPGDFCVQFYGSKDYAWTTLGRVFLFEENDRGSKTDSEKSVSKIFAKGLEEAIDEFQKKQLAKEQKILDEKRKAEDQAEPASYKLVSCNRPCGKVVVPKPDLSLLPTCYCKPEDNDPCGPNSECVNRLTAIECHPELCSAKDKCQNQRFVKAQYADTSIFKVNSRGWGLKSNTWLKEGDFIAEYCGDLVDYPEYKRRLEKQNEIGDYNFYFCVLDKDRVIDARPRGSYARFMNHSCEPNCGTDVWTVNGDARVGLFALRDIPPDTELTFNYDLDSRGLEGVTKTKCFCGAPSCSGYIGVKPKNRTVPQKTTKKKLKKKAARKKMDGSSHDDECFKCGDGGTIILCSRAGCTKAYHISCLGFEKPPFGKWDCPWHFCDECGKLSTKCCAECDNSFCAQHWQGSIFEVAPGVLKCTDCHDSPSSSVKSDPDATASEKNTPTKELDKEPQTISSDQKSENSETVAADLENDKAVSRKLSDSKQTSNKKESVIKAESTELKVEIPAPEVKTTGLGSPLQNNTNTADNKSRRSARKSMPKRRVASGGFADTSPNKLSPRKSSVSPRKSPGLKLLSVDASVGSGKKGAENTPPIKSSPKKLVNDINGNDAIL